MTAPFEAGACHEIRLEVVVYERARKPLGEPAPTASVIAGVAFDRLRAILVSYDREVVADTYVAFMP